VARSSGGKEQWWQERERGTSVPARLASLH